MTYGGAEVAVQSRDERHGGWMGDEAVIVHDIHRVFDVAAHVEARRQHVVRVHFDDAHAGDFAAARGEQRDVVAELDEALAQPHHHALRAAILLDRHAVVLELDDVHQAAPSAAGSAPVFHTASYIRT